MRQKPADKVVYETFLCPVSRFYGGRFPVLTFSLFLVNVTFRYLFYES